MSWVGWQVRKKRPTHVKCKMCLGRCLKFGQIWARTWKAAPLGWKCTNKDDLEMEMEIRWWDLRPKWELEFALAV